MNLLSIDASTGACSASLYTDENIFLRHQIAPREHAKLLLNMVDDLLNEAKIGIDHIDAFAYGAGPGSFTGLRVAASLVQAFAFGTNKNVIPISTLQALAQAAWRRFKYNKVFAALDARMREIYFGFYELDDDNIMRSIVPEQVSSPNVFYDVSNEILLKDWFGVGSGVTTYYESLKKNLPCLEMHESILYPSALEIAILASKQFMKKGGNPVESAIPIYLRNTVAHKQKSTNIEAIKK